MVAITPLGLGPDLNLLCAHRARRVVGRAAARGLLSADRIFHNDYEDGALDVLAMGRCRCSSSLRVKSLAHWLTTGIPLALLAPLLGLLLNLPIEAIPMLVLADARRHARGELRRGDRREPDAGLEAERRCCSRCSCCRFTCRC